MKENKIHIILAILFIIVVTVSSFISRLSTDNDNDTSAVNNYINEFYVSMIPDDIFNQMQGKSYKEDCIIPRNELRYVHILHKDFNGETNEGELICNRIIADDVCEIFLELYEAEYQIDKVRLIDEYNADDEASMADDNSSCFNFRYISHTTKVSKHGLGLAVDINTLYNPYIKTLEDGELSIEPVNGAAYIDRTADFEHKINENDLCYKLFTEHGFEWGGSWENRKDYQHFELPDDIVQMYADQLEEKAA